MSDLRRQRFCLRLSFISGKPIKDAKLLKAVKLIENDRFRSFAKLFPSFSLPLAALKLYPEINNHPPAPFP